MNRFINASTDTQTLRALVRCRSVEMQSLIKLFERVYQESLVALAAADGEKRVHQLQERALMAKDFLDAVNDAVSLVDRSR